MTAFVYRERTTAGQWVAHLLTFDTMREGLDYAEGLASGQAWQVLRPEMIRE